MSGVEQREVATDRFANRIVGQHKLAALCRERGWTFQMHGGFDGGTGSSKHIDAYDLEVGLDIQIPEGSALGDSGLVLELVTGAVQFSRDRAAIALDQVPPRCFSEVMRDLDLFVTLAARPA